MADSSVRRKPAQPQAKSETWLRGPRSLCLKRSEYGFGFTLRHFIVYPPESFSVWEGLGSPHMVDPAQPMDTIFVKQVHADSPASEAGLSTGDRIVGVNGQNVAGFPYSHVVQLIQHSEVYLRLAVVPRENDLLQLYFGATAHNPETNQRPRQRSPEKQASALPVPVHRIHSAPRRPLDNTPHLAKAIKQRQSLDNAPKPRLSLAGGPTPRYRNPARRASEGNPLKREAIYGCYYDNDRLVWDEKRGITREEAPHRDEMVVNRGVGLSRPTVRTAGTPTDSDMSDSSNSLYYQSGGSSAETSRRESRDNLTDSKDSLSSIDSTSTLTGQEQSSDDSLIMNRIRKSFEQKEEFLRRPNQPILYNLGPENLTAVPPIREFYARPQKLQKAMWPPNNPSPRTASPARSADGKPANRNLRRVRSELDSDRDSPRSNDRTLPDSAEQPPRGQFVYGGQVTNVPNSNLNQLAQDAFRPPGSTNTPGLAPTPHRQQRHFVTTLSRIHENLPDNSPSPNYSDSYDETSSPPSDQFARSLSSPISDNRYGSHTEQVQIVSRRARQFETGQLEEEDRTDFYRSELARLSAKKSVPTVALRTKEFESKGGLAERRRHRESRSLEGTGPPASSYSSGNRLILIGTKNVHCEPPRDYHPEKQDRDLLNEGSCLRARSNSAESWAAAFGTPRNASGARNTLEWPLDRKDSEEPIRHKAVRQDSYLAACRTPVNTEPRASRLLKRQGTALDESSEDIPPPSSRPNQEVESDRIPPSANVTDDMVKNQVPATRPTQLSIVPATPSLEIPTADGEAVAHTDVESLISALDNATAQGLMSVDNASIPIVIRRQKNTHHHSNLDDDRLRRASYLKATCGERMHVDSDHEYSDTEQQLRSDHPTQLPTTPTHDNKENLSATREGWLHCKITVIDGKRAGDRSWKQVWAVLTNHTLTLYKDRRDPQQSGQTPAVGESESVDMSCAQVDKAGDYTKRKNVLRLNTLSCSELLLQAADNEDMANWLAVLNQAAKEDCVSLKSPPGSGRLSPLPNKGIRKLTSFRTRSPTGQSPINKTLKPSHTAEPAVGSPKSKTWKGRVARQFRRIQHGANSPSSPTVESRDAYPEGSTIGIPLEHCPMSEENEFVPFLIAKCTAIVEERGLDIIGIYRVPGNTAAISSLTEAVNKGFQFSNFQVGSSITRASPFDSKSTTIDPRWSDVNVISSLLKLFFRKLPDALLTSELYPLFIDADKMEDPNNRITSLRKLIHELPDHHFETLKYLLTHLKRVVNHSSVNKMEARNLAIVFGPTLVRTADNNMVTMVTDMSHQCRIVESLLLYSDWFFSEEEEPSGFPFSLSNDTTAELEATAINHNQSLLLSNIQKVEGMKSDSTGKDILAKVIGSSIISAANRKIQKTRTRRSNANEEQREENERKRKEATGCEDAAIGSSAVATSIVESAIMSGNIVKNLQADGGAGPQETSMDDAPQVAEAESSRKQQGKGVQVPLDYEDGTIRTYAGLSATTQERIRRFEQETKAMLQRDLTRQRDSTQQQGKKDGDRTLADSLADLSRKVPETNNATSPPPAPLSSDARTLSTFTRKFSSSETSSTTMTSTSEQRSPSRKMSEAAVDEPEPVQKTNVSRLNKKSLVSERSQSPHNPQTTQVPSVRTVRTDSRTNVTSDSVKSVTSQTNTVVDNSVESSVRTESSSDVDTGNIKTVTSHIHTNPIADNRMESTIHRIGKKHFFSGSFDSDDNVITHSTVDSLSPFYGETATSEREVPRGSKKHVCDSSSSDERTVRRGSSVENVALAAENAPTAQKTANGTLKRFKTGKEQLAQPSLLMSSLRCGSLDSLQEVFGSDRPPSDVSDDGSDLLSSLTSTFDRKLKSLLSTTPPVVPEEGREEVAVAAASPPRSRIPTYRDPSLHRRVSLTRPLAVQESASTQDDAQPSIDKQTVRRQWLELGEGFSPASTGSEDRQSTTEVRPRTNDNATAKNERPLSANTNKPDPAEKRESTKLKRSESLKKYEKDEAGMSVKLRRAASLTKADSVSNTKLKRSDSLTKTEKTESNISKRRQSEMFSKRKEKENVATTLTKLKRKNGMPERAIKRRHTVGGTKDFDKINWLDNRLQEERLENNVNAPNAPQKLRTSSPDLSSNRVNAAKGREGFLVAISLLGAGRHRPHSLADANITFNVPLESHV